MAKFEEQVTTKAEAIKVEREKKATRKVIKPEEKRKYIAYAILGVLALGFVGYAVNDFSSDEDIKQVQEIGTPETEADKYNTKLQAIEQGDKTKATAASLEDSYRKNDNSAEKENDEAAKKLAEQLKTMENDEKTGTSSAPVRREQNYSSSSRSGGGTQRYSSSNTSRKRVNPENQNNAAPIILNKSEVVDAEPKIKASTKSSGSGFFKSNNKKEASSNSNPTLFASIHSDQIVMDGNRVKMRLTKEVVIDGNKFPINTILYGTAKINPNRLMVEVNKINQTDVSLEIFDAEDSNPGIYVLTPNLNSAIKKELKTEVLDDKDLEKVPFSKSLKNLFSKKAKEEKVELLNNYKVIIKIKRKDAY